MISHDDNDDISPYSEMDMNKLLNRQGELRQRLRDAERAAPHIEHEIAVIEERQQYPGFTAQQVAIIRKIINEESRKAWGQTP